MKPESDTTLPLSTLMHYTISANKLSIALLGNGPSVLPRTARAMASETEAAHGCPYQGQTSSAEALNPNTNLPNANVLQKSSSEDESVNLAADRTASSIPRSDSQQKSTWLYPSPRMFYNALKRKGYETRPEDIHAMLHVHNFLNEQVWEQIRQWEASYSR
jgi:hypothetical protein